MNKDRKVTIDGEQFIIKLNNRGGIHDIQPRLFNMYYILYGRQYSSSEVKTVYEREKARAEREERWN